jgi:hypothetical protein
MKTIKEWVLENYEYDTIVNITNHGMVSGFGQLVYYTDTVKFYDEFEVQIWDMLYEDAENAGMTLMELIASFNGQKNVGSGDQFKNLLCWYAVEEVARQIVEEKENEDE